LCRPRGVLLGFDESITGFQICLRGAQAHFGVAPDLACFGRAMANGVPLSAIVGRGEIIRLFEQMFFSFTHRAEAASLAACRATIGELKRRNGIAALGRAGERLQQGTWQILPEWGLGVKIARAGLPPWTALRCAASAEESLLWRSLFQAGGHQAGHSDFTAITC
jgi:glutamate-1-semialdehyde aminotransferase